MKKLDHVQLKEAIRTGTQTETFLQSKDYELTLRDGVVIDIVSKKNGKKTQTSLFNVSGWTEADEQPQRAAKASKK
jgi:hypothetical protein